MTRLEQAWEIMRAGLEPLGFTSVRVEPEPELDCQRYEVCHRDGWAAVYRVANAELRLAHVPAKHVAWALSRAATAAWRKTVN